MSKTIKNLIIRELGERLKDVDGVAVINPRGIDAVKNNQIRRRLREKGLRMTVVRNTLVKRAIGESRLKGFESLLEGPCALVYGKASIAAIARHLLEEQKQEEKLELRGVFFDGEVYPGQQGVEKVSKLPTREEAIGTILAALLGPGRKLASSIQGPGRRVAGVLRTVEDKAWEKEPAAPAAA